jgi:hypothetical protein
MEALRERYADLGITFMVVYTREPHPGFGGHPQPRTLDQRSDHARVCRAELDDGRGYLIDDLDSSIQNQFGRLPNSCYVIDTSGTVVYKESWSNPANLERVLKRLVNAKARPRRAKPPKRRRYY